MIWIFEKTLDKAIILLYHVFGYKRYIARKKRMQNPRRELRRGTIELILLKLLETKEMYGYQLASVLAEKGGEMLQIKEGTLYPVLYRLEDRGFIISYRNNPKRGVPRKYYRLTGKGTKYLEKLLEEWKNFSAVVEGMISDQEENK